MNFKAKIFGLILASGADDSTALLAGRERGVLRVLTRNNASTYFVYRGHVMGFEYDLVREFAKRHGLHAEFIVVPTRAGVVRPSTGSG